MGAEAYRAQRLTPDLPTRGVHVGRFEKRRSKIWRDHWRWVRVRQRNLMVAVRKSMYKAPELANEMEIPNKDSDRVRPCCSCGQTPGWDRARSG